MLRLDLLVHLPSSAELAATHAQAVADLEKIRARPSAKVLVLDDERRAQRVVETALRNVEYGHQRDLLQAERPEGCWCLGEGGRTRRYYSEDVWGFEEYCPCPDGVESESRVKAELTRRGMERRQRDVARIFAGAAIPTRFALVTFDSYPASDATQSAVADIRAWVTAPPDGNDEVWDAWYGARKRSLFLHGPYGTGKTGLAVSAMRVWVEQFQDTALFITVPNLLDRIRDCYGPHAVSSERELIDTVKTVDVLVLDDLGAERVTDWVAEKLFTVINHRHDEDLSTIFTSNLSLDELAAHIGERTVWRIVEMSKVIRVEGPNLRDPK